MKSDVDLLFYHQVKFQSIACIRSTPTAYYVSFQMEQKRQLNWGRSKRLIFGSLVCLVTGDFKSLIWGTVIDRDEKKLPTKKGDHIIGIQVEDSYFYYYYFFFLLYFCFFLKN